VSWPGRQEEVDSYYIYTGQEALKGRGRRHRFDAGGGLAQEEVAMGAGEGAEWQTMPGAEA